MNAHQVKSWLARVNHQSWHFKLVQEWSSVPRKACTYYWICVPGAMFKSAGAIALMCFVGAVGYMLGFTPAWRDGDSGGIFFPYKKTRGGRKKVLAPWEIAVASGLLWAIWKVSPFFIVHWRSILGVIVAIVIASALAIVIYYERQRITSVAQRPVAGIKRFWEKACPDLEIK